MAFNEKESNCKNDLHRWFLIIVGDDIIVSAEGVGMVLPIWFNRPKWRKTHHNVGNDCVVSGIMSS